MLKRIIIVITLAFLFPSSVSAATYFVATNGNDSNTGTIQQPFKTIQKGIDRLQSGDTLYIRKGTYNLYQGSTQEKIFVTKNNVTIAGYPQDNEKPILRGVYHHNYPSTPFPYSENKYSPLLALHGVDNITIDSIKVQNADGICLSISNAQNTVVKNSYFGICFGQGISINGGSKNVLIQNNEVTATNMGQYFGDRGIPWGAALRVRNGGNDNIVINGNVIHETFGEGVVVGIESDNIVVEDNIVYDTWALLYYRARGKNITIRNNIGFYTDNKTFWRGARGTKGNPGTPGKTPGSGIVFANEHGDGIPAGATSYIYNNLIVNTGSGIDFWKQKDGSLEDAYFFNNTVIGSYEYNYSFSDPCGIGSNSNATNCQWVGNPKDHSAVFFNNVSLNPKNKDILVGQSNGINYYNNIWSTNNVPAKVKNQNDFYGLTVQDVFSTLPTNSYSFYTNNKPILKQSYVGINKSANLPTGLPSDINLQKDLLGCTRDNRPDIGAIEYGATNCNVNTIPTPADPTPTVEEPAPSVTPLNKYDVTENGVVDILDIIDVIKYVFGG